MLNDHSLAMDETSDRLFLLCQNRQGFFFSIDIFYPQFDISNDWINIPTSDNQDSI